MDKDDDNEDDDDNDDDDNGEDSGVSSSTQVAAFNDSISKTQRFGMSSFSGCKGKLLSADHLLKARLPKPLQNSTLGNAKVSPRSWLQCYNFSGMHRANLLSSVDEIRCMKSMAWLYATELGRRQTLPEPLPTNNNSAD